MTAEQYNAACKRLGLDIFTAATLLGVAVRTTRRWEDGTRAVPPPVARFLALLIALKKDGAWAIKKLEQGK